MRDRPLAPSPQPRTHPAPRLQSLSMTPQTQSPQTPLAKFNFTPQPAAQRLIDSLVNQFLARCPGAADLSARMSEETGTRFKDWIDHIQVPRTAETAARLKELGFSHRPQPGAPECFSHEGAMFPSITLGGPSTGPASGATRVAIKVDSVADFLAVSQISDAEVIGEPLGQLRLAPAFRGRGTEMWIVERHGTRAFEPAKSNPAKAILSLRHLEAFRRRNRHFRTDAEGFAILNVLVDAAVKDLGKDWACDLFFAAEREYWQRRNRAAQVQRARQDKLGLGWANHDHHTYRSSRQLHQAHRASRRSWASTAARLFMPAPRRAGARRSWRIPRPTSRPSMTWT